MDIDLDAILSSQKFPSDKELSGNLVQLKKSVNSIVYSVKSSNIEALVESSKRIETMGKKIANLYRPLTSTTIKSLSNFNNVLPSINVLKQFNNPFQTNLSTIKELLHYQLLLSSQSFSSYEKTIQTMRAFSNKNYFIDRQWSELNSIKVNTKALQYLLDKENSKKLSENLNISVNVFSEIQNMLPNHESFFSEEAVNQIRDAVCEQQTSSNDIPTKDRQNYDGTSANHPKKFHDISPFLKVWLFVNFLSLLLMIDGTNNSNKIEANIGSAISFCTASISQINSDIDSSSHKN